MYFVRDLELTKFNILILSLSPTQVCEYVVNVVFSLIASIVLHLFIELPSINLYNVYFLGSFELFTLKMNRKLHRKDTSSKNNSSFWFM